MTPHEREVMQQALYYMDDNCGAYTDDYRKTIEALRAALAQPESVAIAELNQTWTQEHWTEYERGIAAAEREACAQVCEANGHPDPTRIDQAKICASAIRTRGQA